MLSWRNIRSPSSSRSASAASVAFRRSANSVPVKCNIISRSSCRHLIYRIVEVCNTRTQLGDAEHSIGRTIDCRGIVRLPGARRASIRFVRLATGQKEGSATLSASLAWGPGTTRCFESLPTVMQSLPSRLSNGERNQNGTVRDRLWHQPCPTSCFPRSHGITSAYYWLGGTNLIMIIVWAGT